MQSLLQFEAPVEFLKASCLGYYIMLDFVIYTVLLG
jgi:hypothetical protein